MRSGYANASSSPGAGAAPDEAAAGCGVHLSLEVAGHAARALERAAVGPRAGGLPAQQLQARADVGVGRAGAGAHQVALREHGGELRGERGCAECAGTQQHVRQSRVHARDRRAHVRAH